MFSFVAPPRGICSQIASFVPFFCPSFLTIQFNSFCTLGPNVIGQMFFPTLSPSEMPIHVICISHCPAYLTPAGNLPGASLLQLAPFIRRFFIRSSFGLPPFHSSFPSLRLSLLSTLPFSSVAFFLLPLITFSSKYCALPFGNKYLCVCPFLWTEENCPSLWAIPKFGHSIGAFGAPNRIRSDQQLSCGIGSLLILAHSLPSPFPPQRSESGLIPAGNWEVHSLLN